MIIILTLNSCLQPELKGTWTVTEVNTENYQPLSALPNNNTELERPRYDSTLLNSQGTIFYLATELGAKFDFQDKNLLATTSFLANFGRTTFKFDRASSELVIEHSASEPTSEPVSRNEIYKGYWEFKDETTSVWKLDNGKLLTLKKE